MLAYYYIRIQNKSEVKKMSEHEKEILNCIAATLPLMSERKKGELIGYAQARVDIKKSDVEKEEGGNEKEGV